MLLVAVGEGRTLSGAEEHQLNLHVARCAKCREVAAEPVTSKLRWVARIPEDAFDDPDRPERPVLPMVDPIVFAMGDPLARGGMGKITRARDRRLGRDVAVKEVLAPYLRARFEREALITARLQHPAIVPVYEAGTWPDGSAFYTMRLVSGGTLDAAIARTTTLEERLALLPHVLALTEALAYAHSRRVVHRDLKPANVLVGEFGETVVIDWGLARDLTGGVVGGVAGGVGAVIGGGLAGAMDRTVAAPDASADPTAADLTQAGSVVGTPCYMPPEQAAGGEIDERADVYALGAILYTLLAGQPPHWDTAERSADRLIAAVQAAPPTPIAELAPRAPADLRAIVERAMARDKAARYPSAKELAEELRRFEAGQLLGSREYTARELIARWIRRHRAAVAVGAVAIAVVAIVGAVSVHQIVVRERQTAHALAESQLEQGRQLLAGGDPGQAAPYLAAALAALPDDPVAQRLAATAVRDASRRLARFPGTAAAFRHDGAELAIGHADGTIAVVDPATGAVRRTLPSLGGAIAALEYSPDGSRLAVASVTGAYLRDASGDRSVTASDDPASQVRFLPGGDRIAITTATSLTLVGLDGAPLALDDRVAQPRALAVSRDGGRLVAVTLDGTIAWRTSDLARVAHVGTDGVLRFAAVVDRDDVITAGSDGVRRWRPGGEVTTLYPEQIVTLSWLGDHELLGDRVVIDTATGAIREFAHNSIEATAIIDRTHAITGGYDRALRVWDLERTARPIAVLDPEAATSMLAVDPTGQRAATRGAQADAGIELWDVTRLPGPVRTTVVTVDAGSPPGSQPGPQPGLQIDAVVTDRRDRIAVHVHDGPRQTTCLVSTDFARVATIDGWPVGFRPGADELATDIDGRIALYAGRDGRHLRDITGPDKIWHVAFSDSGAVIATAGGRRVSLRDASWRITRDLEVATPVSSLAVDDRGRLVTGHEDGTLRIWDARDGRLLATASGHSANIAELAITGDELISNSWDLTTRRWALPSGEPRGLVRRFDRIVDAVTVSPGGQLIAAAEAPATVSLWDSAQGRLLAQIPTADQLRYVAFLDDDHLIAGGDGGRLELLDVSQPPRALDEVIRLVAGQARWHLVDGRAIERGSLPAADTR
ncbi:MAG TPA: protein kinase [Kofleriaceae bacterium]|nr:protein kinase [Kofleriaceae bacterium]